MASKPRTAAIVTVGSELVEGLRVDTNTAEIARALGPRGFTVLEALSVGDDEQVLSAALRTLFAARDLVIITGGLGPTHDDVTREAVAEALGLQLAREQRLVDLLEPVVARHADPEARGRLMVQAEVLEGADVIEPTTGTAAGQIAPTPAGSVVLLPGPPSEMRPMLATALSTYPLVRAEPQELGVTGMTESDAQVRASRVLMDFDGVSLTVLATPGDVRILLFDNGAGAKKLAKAAEKTALALGDRCYSSTGERLEEAIVRIASEKGLTFALAESCTGGMVAAAITDIAGASEVFLGGAVTYSNEAKTAMLGVPRETLAVHGAVSDEAARAMAVGARDAFDADIAVSVTGVAGPGGGTTDKPVGLVWFATATQRGCAVTERRFPPTSREAIRARATSVALDLLRRALIEE